MLDIEKFEDAHVAGPCNPEYKVPIIVEIRIEDK